MQEQWEYCELGMSTSKENDRKNHLWGYDVWINYLASDGRSIFQQLSALGDKLSFNPWRRALGLLGGAGWELVNVQHGNASTGTAINWQNTLIWDNRVAYLKRRVLPGRAVDEPKLVLQ